jgi:hypothetical protein
MMERTISSVSLKPILLSLVGALIHSTINSLLHCKVDIHTLEFWLSGDGIAVDLITTSDHTMQSLGMMSEDHIFPQRIITGFVLSFEFIGIDTRRETWYKLKTKTQAMTYHYNYGLPIGDSDSLQE